MNVIDRAREYSHAAHDSINQKRKYSGEPYWAHTDEVAEIVAGVTKRNDMIAAAHLHDVLEDVPSVEGGIYSPEHLRATFGKEIALLVRHLTDAFTNHRIGNRARRKELERYRLSHVPAEVHTIKLADLISNTRSIVKDDPDFAVTYMAEKRLLVPMLRRGHATLARLAKEQIDAYYEQ